MTYFPYLRKIWQKNTEEERLLGVSFTGIYDCPLMNDYNDPELPARLERLRQVAIDTNKEWSEKLGINQSVAITCVKPSGTVSQLVLSPSGIHPGHDRYYIRRVRSDNKDPLTKHLIDAGVPHEPDVTKPHATTVFSFPMRLPDSSITRENVNAIDHLELWLKYQRHWCEHKPSVTINVREEEWPRVGSWVYDHFDEMSGVSFLPHDGGTYRQAPYETITQADYEDLNKNIPTKVDWDALVEMDDNVEGVQTLACTSGNCEI
jgi:ribonucleoside-diphosphate reductase alpha chain